MGFGVRFSFDTPVTELLSKLVASPAAVFGRPYCGYLLMLAGSLDRETAVSIQNHLHALDSLTGPHIAFATFARELPISIRVRNGNSRHPKRLGEIELSKVDSSWKLERVIKQQTFGLVADGDWLVATTYAVDDLARALG